ncbi:hypothetical protein CMI37_25040 [Candidatus Pacearchaeota archaeon]|nr:hypothetical protein [Candidatus Pacearchaeota archaeon]|tara:strand:- start:6036 stop:6488 length:453 start_codon:yes stop_codon:yes gene_type:complete
MVFEHDFKNFPELTNKQMEHLQFVSPHKQITEDFDATVVKVHDGDTVTLRAAFRDFDFPLRLIGIDAPEMNAGGAVARDWLKARVLGSSVRIEIDKKERTEKWGRLLGRLIHRGMDVAQEEIYLGLAPPYEERGEEIPNINETLSLKQWL